MVEINEWLWEGLYTLKKLYDKGKMNLLEQYSTDVLDGDNVGLISMEALYEVFADTLDSYDEKNDLDTYVFFDPIFDEFNWLCEIYEAEKHIKRSENPHRAAVLSAIRSGMYFGDYSYGYWYYDGTQRDGKAKLILKLYPEFCACYEIAGGLLEVYEAFDHHVKALKEELDMKQPNKIVLLPQTEPNTLKEAA